MSKKSAKKVRRIEVEKVKNGKGGHLHKVTAHYHSSPGREGGGLSGAMAKYHDPEETFHNSAGAAHKHMKGLLSQMTSTPEEEVDAPEEEPSAPRGPVGDTGSESEEDAG